MSPTRAAVPNPADGVLVFTPSEWDAFVSGAQDGKFDRP
ncbi:DUF397 domain-containing protein [Nocardia gipuzkoensis]